MSLTNRATRGRLVLATLIFLNIYLYIIFKTLVVLMQTRTAVFPLFDPIVNMAVSTVAKLQTS